MSKLSSRSGEKEYDAAGYQKQQIVLVVPVTIDGSGSFTGKFLFVTAYNCNLQEYTTNSYGLSLENIEGDSDYDTQRYIVSFETTILLSYIANQTAPGVVNAEASLTPVNITTQNISTVFHFPNEMGVARSWIDLNDMPICLTLLNFKEFNMNLSYYDEDNEVVNNKVALFSCQNKTETAYKIHKNEVTYDDLFTLIYQSLNEIS